MRRLTRSIRRQAQKDRLALAAVPHFALINWLLKREHLFPQVIPATDNDSSPNIESPTLFDQIKSYLSRRQRFMMPCSRTSEVDSHHTRSATTETTLKQHTAMSGRQTSERTGRTTTVIELHDAGLPLMQLRHNAGGDSDEGKGLVMMRWNSGTAE